MAEEKEKEKAEEKAIIEEIPVVLPQDKPSPEKEKPKISEVEEAAPKGEITPTEAKAVAKGEYVTIKQLANTLGYSVAWVTKLVQEGRIHGTKPLGGNWRIPKGEVERLTKVGLRKPITASEVEASEIKVTDEHINRVITKPTEKKEETPEDKKTPWPLSFFIKE